MGIYYGDLPISYYTGGRDTSDATIVSKDVLQNEVAYGKDGKIIGEAPFSFVNDNLYKLEDTVLGTNITAEDCGKRHLAISHQEEPWTLGYTFDESGDYLCDYANGKLFLIGEDKILYSIDGANWENANIPTSFSPTHVCYNNNIYIAIDSYSTSSTIIYSQDGVNWTAKEISYEIKQSSKVCCGSGKFIIFSWQTSNILYSEDGINWNSLGTQAPMSTIFYGKDKFVGVNKNLELLYSYDGLNWNLCNAPQGTWMSGCYGNGKYLFVSDTTSDIIISSDGISWESYQITIDDDLCTIYYPKLAYGAGMFVMVADNLETTEYYGGCLTTSDGVNWTVNTDLVDGNGWNDITYGNNKFLIINSGSGSFTNFKPAVYFKNCFNSLRFEDEPIIVTSTVELEDGISQLSAGTFYFVLEE